MIRVICATILCVYVINCSGTGIGEVPIDAGVGAVVDALCTIEDQQNGTCPDGGGGSGPPPTPTCRSLGCNFAPWGWCGAAETPCDGRDNYSSNPAQASCEWQAMATCASIGYPIGECWIVFADNCSLADEQAMYLHCLRVDHLPYGSPCRLQWR